MQHALVTGSEGFIGSHLKEELLKRRWSVTGFDFPLDVTKKDDWILSLKDVDIIFHLAGKLDHYDPTKCDLASYINVNVKSIAVMFEAILEGKFPVKKIIVASSQSVYGEGNYTSDNPVPQHEVNTLKPISIYGASKAAMEDILFTLGRIYQIPIIALRYSIVLGAGQKFKDLDSRIIPAFVEMAKQGMITTHEDGKQSRDFVHIDDVTDATIFCAEQNLQGTFNVGSGELTKVMEVAEYIANKYKAAISKSGIKRINTARHSPMSINRIQAMGWKPKKTWKDAVNDYIKSEG